MVQHTTRIAGLAGMMLALLVAIAPASAVGPVKGLSKVGTCAITRVTTVAQRLVDGATGKSIPDSGSTVVLANGVVGVSYDQVPAVNASHPGDRVRTCLFSLPTNCPKGDDRGRTYRTTNLRTKGQWTLPDSEHFCGGA